MKSLFNDNLELTDEGVKIQDEFEILISSFFKKYGGEYNPIEFEWMVNASLSFKNTSNYLNTVHNIKTNP